MVFSHDGRYLLSVSRDRSWALFEIDETSISNNCFFNFHFFSFKFKDFQARLLKRVSSNNSYHKRIIWTCDFSHDDKYFATGARDQMIHIWRVNDKASDDNEQPCEKNYLKLNDSITAVTFASKFIDSDKFERRSLVFNSYKKKHLLYLDILLQLDLIMVIFFYIHGMNKHLGSNYHQYYLRKRFLYRK